MEEKRMEDVSGGRREEGKSALGYSTTIESSLVTLSIFSSSCYNCIVLTRNHNSLGP